MKLYTDVEVATDILRIPVEQFHTLRKRHGWPVVKIGRFEYRFTEAQVEHIIAQQTETPERAPAARPASVAGQTKRSASRGRAKAVQA